MKFQSVVVFFVACIISSAIALRCYTCQDDGCHKKNKATECTPDKLKNVGPGITSFTDIKMNSEITGAVPPFECMKVEARDVHNGNLVVSRRCQIKMANNQSCEHFYRNINTPPIAYTNASCSLCGTDDCNSGESLKVWSMLIAPTLIISSVLLFGA